MISSSILADSRSEIENRIKPLGQVQIQGDVNSKIQKAVVVSAKPKVAAAMSGETVYKKHCVVCHASGIAGAPKAHDEASWASRKDRTIDSLLKTAISGINAMPAKGTCMTCTDNELKAAIIFMRPK